LAVRWQLLRNEPKNEKKAKSWQASEAAGPLKCFCPRISFSVESVGISTT